MSLKTLLSGTSPFALRLPQPVFAPDGEGAGGGAAEGEDADDEGAAEGEGDDAAGGEAGEVQDAGAASGEGGDGAGADGETAEVEFEGVTYQMPKALASSIMMHKDYTQKTMEIGEQRRTLDTEKQSNATERAQIQEAQQFVQRFAREVAQVENLNEQIKQYEKIDWAAWRQSNAAEALQHQGIRQELIEKRGALMQGLERAVGEATQKQSETMRQREAAAETEIRRTIKDWGPQKVQEFTDFGTKAYGFTPAELSSMKQDPRIARALNDLQTFHAAKAKARPAQVVVEPKPVVRVGGSAKNVAKNPETMSGDEYQRWFYSQQQAQKRA